MSEAVSKIKIAGSNSANGVSMIEAEATAAMLLMTEPFRSPEETEEPIEVTLVRAILAGEVD